MCNPRQTLIKSFEIIRNRNGESGHEPTQGCLGENTVGGVSTKVGLE